MRTVSRIKCHGVYGIALAILFLACLLLVEGVAAQSSLSYEAYLARIGRWRERARVAQGQEAADCARILGEVADEMGGITAVQMPDGTNMAVNHEGIVASLRATPCNPARADSLLAGICPTHVCPVGQAPINSEIPELNDQTSPSDGSPSPIGTLSPELAQELEEQLQTGQDAGNEAVPGGDGAGGATGSPSDPSSGGGGPNGDPADSDGTGGDAAEPGGEMADPGPEGEGPGEPSDETGDGATGDTPGDAGEGGSEASEGDGASGGTDTGGDDAGNSEAASAGEQNEAGGSGTTDGAGGGGETAVSAPDAAIDDPSLPPLEIAPPVETERPRWLWVIVGLAIAAMLVGAVLFLWEPGEVDDKGKKRTKMEPETSEEAVDEGRALIAAGNYRGAVRHLFLAALLTLDERKLLQYDTTRTNYELLEEVRLRPIIVETLVPVIETFERVWYGFETVGLTEYDALAGQIELLKQV